MKYHCNGSKMTDNVLVCHTLSFLWARSAKSVGYKRCEAIAVFHFGKKSVSAKLVGEYSHMYILNLWADQVSEDVIRL